jgi:pimeloyl-ACP methyl ester carboxylesterase
VTAADFTTPTDFVPHDRGVGRPELPVVHDVLLPGRGTTAVYSVEGPPDSMPVLLLHGWTVTAALNWFQVFRPLATHHRVISFDQRGHGHGIRPDGRWRLDHAVDDAVALLDALGIEQVILAGYSMGGAVAQLLARRHPERVRGLVLAATWSKGPTHTIRNQILRGSHLAGWALRGMPRRRQIQAVRSVWARLAPTDPTSRPAWFVAEVMAGSFPHIVEAGRELMRFDSRDWLHELAMPTGVMITTNDSVVPLRRQRVLADRIPSTIVREVAIDHDGCVTDPDRFVEPFVQLVTDVARR